MSERREGWRDGFDMGYEAAAEEILKELRSFAGLEKMQSIRDRLVNIDSVMFGNENEPKLIRLVVMMIDEELEKKFGIGSEKDDDGYLSSEENLQNHGSDNVTAMIRPSEKQDAEIGEVMEITRQILEVAAHERVLCNAEWKKAIEKALPCLTFETFTYDCVDPVNYPCGNCRKRKEILES